MILLHEKLVSQSSCDVVEYAIIRGGQSQRREEVRRTEGKESQNVGIGFIRHAKGGKRNVPGLSQSSEPAPSHSLHGHSDLRCCGTLDQRWDPHARKLGLRGNQVRRKIGGLSSRPGIGDKWVE